MSCDSWDSNAPYDVIPIPTPGDHLEPVSCYLGENMEKYITHPYASPLFGDFHGLPPMLIQSGDSEVLRDEITLLAHKATLAGVEVRHELYEDAVRRLLGRTTATLILLCRCTSFRLFLSWRRRAKLFYLVANLLGMFCRYIKVIRPNSWIAQSRPVLNRKWTIPTPR